MECLSGNGWSQKRPGRNLLLPFLVMDRSVLSDGDLETLRCVSAIISHTHLLPELTV